MPQDILFRTEEALFSLRAGGILIRAGRILLQRPPEDDYAIPGGHVGLQETGAEALEREFEEELHARVRVGRLRAVGEIYFSWKDRPCHQICLYYDVDPEDPEALSLERFRGFDECGMERTDLEYAWVPLEDLRKGTVVYPLELVPALLTPEPGTVHFISRQEDPRDADAERTGGGAGK